MSNGPTTEPNASVPSDSFAPPVPSHTALVASLSFAGLALALFALLLLRTA